MSYLRAETPGQTLACPECDMGQRWYVRQDGTVRCRECGHECDREELVERPSERGEHTPPEANARGGRIAGSQHSEEHLQAIGKLGGRSEQYDLDECKFAILRVARQVEGSPTLKDYQALRMDGDPSWNVIQDRFGSWNKAKEELGLTTDNRGRPLLD